MSKCLFILAFIFMLYPAQANAHVLITDESGQIGAILHVNPDDDPIAGEESTLFFDIQNKQVSDKGYVFSLTIQDAGGATKNVSIAPTKTTVSATYIFPSQGEYNIKLAATSDKNTYQFSYTQRISRGTVASGFDKPVHEWAEILQLASAVSILLLLVQLLSHRKQVGIYSKW